MPCTVAMQSSCFGATHNGVVIKKCIAIERFRTEMDRARLRSHLTIVSSTDTSSNTHNGAQAFRTLHAAPPNAE